MANQNKQLKKMAKKALKNDKVSRKQSNKSVNEIGERLQIARARLNTIRNSSGKRELENIEDEALYPLTLASNYIPIKNIQNGVIETTDNRFLKICEVEPVNFDLKNEHEQEKIISSFEKYLRIAPKSFQVKCLSRKASVDRMISEIQKCKVEEKYEDVKELYDNQIDFIKKTARNEAISRRFFVTFEYESESRVEAGNRKKAERQLYDYEETARKYLKTCGNTVYETNEKKNHEQAKFIYDILNRNKAFDIPFEINITDVRQRYLSQNNKMDISSIPIRDYVSPQSIDFRNSRYVVIDGTYYSFMFLQSNGYHENEFYAWFSILTNLGEGIDADLFVRKYDRELMKDKVARSTRINKLRLNDTNAESQNTDNLTVSVDSGNFIKEGLKNNEDFYYVNTMITITAENLEALEYKVKEVKKYLKTNEYGITTCVNKQEAAYNSYMPFNTIDKQLDKQSKQNVLTKGLSMFYPFTSYEMSGNGGVMIGTAENSALVSLDNFNNHLYKNANMVILGTSGAGKTYDLNIIALRQRLMHIPVCIIAPLKAEEFARSCEKVKGSFITISPDSSNCINIMEIRPKSESNNKFIDGEIVSESSLLVEKVQDLLIFFSLLVPDITYEEKQLIDEEIINTYKDFGITHDNKSLYNEDGTVKTMPILGDLYEKLMGNADTKRIANILKRLVTGSAKTFNKQTNVDLNNEYTVIDISRLTGDLLVVGMFVALNYVWSKAKEDRTKLKTIIIDELWKLLGSNELAAEYVLEIFKIIRGYGGSAIGATQDLGDFYSLAGGKFGKGIINNSKIKFVLQLEHDEACVVQKALNLNDNERDKIESFERGTAMLIANNNNMIVNFKASPLEHRYITTSRTDLEKIAMEEKRKMGA